MSVSQARPNSSKQGSVTKERYAYVDPLVRSIPGWKPKRFMADIAREFLASREFSLEDMRHPSRKRPLAHVRQELIWVMVKKYGKGLSEVGRFLNRDHSTVSHAVAAHEARLAAEPEPVCQPVPQPRTWRHWKVKDAA